jgi:alkylhydroperoxidase family enzyme
MAALALADTTKLTGKAQELLSGIEKSMGMTPNFFKQLANSPAALESFLSTRDSLSKGLLDPKMGMLIGILIAETYSCEYMLAARMAMARKADVSEEELRLARQQTSKDPKIDAGLQFVRNVVLRHADISPANIAEVKEAGYSDGEIVELVAHTTYSLFGYYLIKIAQPELDFPNVPTAFPA